MFCIVICVAWWLLAAVVFCPVCYFIVVFGGGPGHPVCRCDYRVGETGCFRIFWFLMCALYGMVYLIFLLRSLEDYA